ncbi:hypothetical protein DFJ73DRAFT_289101 [Zopfochytrium polystomum]|nr:hypothetical protein DFJ73DRAFT_289101 [Zopfochytrium polystomum]
MSAASPSMPTPSTYLPKSHTARLTMETRLSDPQRQQHHPIHRISPFTPFSSAANTIAQTIQRLQSASVGPLILPRTSSLTALVLDLPAVVQGVLRSLPLAHVQRLSRINKQWRELAASVLARQTFALTLSFDGGEREWSVLVFPFEEYLLDASSDEGARGPVKGYRQNLTGRDSAILLDSEDDEVPAEPESYLTTSAVKVTKYKPVTFNKESCLPATQPIRTEDISQICIAPVSRGAPRTFSMKAPALDLVSDEPYLEPLQLYDEPDPLSTPKSDVCCRGRLPRRDNVFSEALFGARCGLVLTPSGADVDYFVVVSEEEDGAGGAGLGGGDAPGWQTVAIGGPVLVSEGRWRELLKFQKELETAAGATAFRGSLQRAPFFGAKGGGNALDARELFAIIDTVAVRNYLSCTEDQKVFGKGFKPPPPHL